MKSAVGPNVRADVVAAWAVGVGVGLLTLMIVWLVGNRIFGLVFDAPLGPTVALITALVLAAFVTAVSGQRCARIVRN